MSHGTVCYLYSLLHHPIQYVKNCWVRLLSNFNIKYIWTIYTRLDTCLMSISRFSIWEKVTLSTIEAIFIPPLPERVYCFTTLLASTFVFRQVFTLYKLNSERFPTMGLYFKFGLNRIPEFTQGSVYIILYFLWLYDEFFIILYNMLKIAELDCCQILILSIYVPSTHAYGLLTKNLTKNLTDPDAGLTTMARIFFFEKSS
jgi:hypothetical protein